jgi:hypothetical protein
MCLILLGVGILIVLSERVYGIVSATVFVVIGLILVFANRRGEI